MRKDRLINIWSKVEPSIRKISHHLLLKFKYSNYEAEDLIQEGFIILKKLKTTKKKPLNLSYLNQRLKYRLKRILMQERIDDKDYLN